MRTFFTFICLAVLFAVTATARAAPKQVGDVLFAKGATTTQAADGSARLLGKGATLYEGDVLTTARRSFAVIKMIDGSKMTLRPNTVFQVKKFTQGEEEKDNNAIMRLFKGGLRALTGLIGKRNPNGYRIQTAVATIGIRGTEFDARLCTDDCAKEQREMVRVAAESTSEVVARVAFLRGRITARSPNAPRRKVVVGGPLLEGDVVETGTGSITVLAFRDQSRVTLQANSRFLIERVRFEPTEPEKGSMLFRLFKGGMRAITGLVGRHNRRGYKVATPVATIGIRGTGFDLVCQGDCGEGGGAQTSLPESLSAPLRQLFGKLVRNAYASALPRGSGLFTHVWSGKIVFELSSGKTVEVSPGQLFFASRTLVREVTGGAKRQFIDSLPGKPQDLVPDEKVRELFSAVKGEFDPGLYVTVYKGHVTLKDDTVTVDLGNGEAGHVGGEGAELELVRLETPPMFQLQDVFPKPGELTDKTLELLNLISDDLQSPEREGGFECEVR